MNHLKSVIVRSAGTLAVAGALSLTAVQPAAAQSPGDGWKSAAIIGGSTAAGAIIGGKLYGPKGAAIGAAAGATTGYVVDRHRRQNEYNNYYGYNNAPYGNYQPGGYYGPNDGGYYPQNASYPVPYGQYIPAPYGQYGNYYPGYLNRR